MSWGIGVVEGDLYVDTAPEGDVVIVHTGGGGEFKLWLTSSEARVLSAYLLEAADSTEDIARRLCATVTKSE